MVNVSPPAATIHHTYRPLLLIAEPPEGKVHPAGVVEVTAPSATHSRSRPAVGTNIVPAATDPLFGSTVWVVVPLRGAAIAAWFTQVAMAQPH